MNNKKSHGKAVVFWTGFYTNIHNKLKIVFLDWEINMRIGKIELMRFLGAVLIMNAHFGYQDRPFQLSWFFW